MYSFFRRRHSLAASLQKAEVKSANKKAICMPLESSADYGDYDRIPNFGISPKSV